MRGHTFGRPFFAALLAAPLLMLGACNPGGQTGGVNSASEVLAGSVDSAANTLIDEKAYYGLLQGEAILNRQASNAVDMGLLKAGSPTAVKIADILVKYAEVSVAAQRAKALNDAVGVTAKITEGKSLYKQVLALITKGN